MPAGSICLVGMGWEDGLPEAITRTASSGGYSPGHLGWNSFTERSKKLKLGCLFLFISGLTLPENYLSFLLHFTCPANLQRNQLIAWSLVQSLSRVWVCDSKLCSRPGSSVSQSLLKFLSFEAVMSSIHLILYHPLLLLPSVFPSTRVFSKVQIPSLRAASRGSHRSPWRHLPYHWREQVPPWGRGLQECHVIWTLTARWTPPRIFKGSTKRQRKPMLEASRAPLGSIHRNWGKQK